MCIITMKLSTDLISCDYVLSELPERLSEGHFPNLSSLDGKMKLVSERHCDVLSNVIHETVKRGHEYQRCSEGAAVTIEVHRTLHLSCKFST